MGEKRAYKFRKPGGGRKKLKPEYDAEKNLKEQMDAAVALYDSEMSLQAIGDEMGLNPIKVRKLLITAGVYESEVAEKVQATFQEYRETQDYKTSILSTANILQLSKVQKSPRLLRRGRVFLFFRLFSFFLLRCNFVTGVDCHTHADQRAASEILVSLHQLFAARVEASCHAGKCAK